MLRLNFLALSIFVLAFFSSPSYAQTPPDVSGYQLNWFDNFDGSSIDTDKWTPIFSTSPTNNSLHAYLPDNVIVGGGNLALLSEDIPFGQFAYRSGQVISTALTRYGRFEVRANLPTSQGMWPAIWLLPDIPPLWPSQGEIDIMENRGNQPFLTSSAFHWGTNPPFYHNFVYDEHELSKNGSQINFHDSFHTYCAEWDPEQIRYYVDGVHLYTVRNENVESFMTTLQTNPMRLIINTAIGGNFLPNPDGSTVWPQFFEVDYVWVYDRIGSPTLELENGDFETDGGSLSNWTVFGNNGQNVSSDNAFALSGNSSLKVFGQFTGNTNYSGVEQGLSVAAGEELELTARVYVDASDPLNTNQALLKVDYYSELYAAFDSSGYLSSDSIVLANSGTNTNQWITRQLTVDAPAGAVEARAAIVFEQNDNSSGAVYVDDIEFGPTTITETITPNSIEFQNGKVVGGILNSVNESDDDYIEILSDSPGNDLGPVAVVVTATSPFANPIDIDINLESFVNTPGLTQKIEALNFNTGMFDVIDERAGSLKDTVAISGAHVNDHMSPTQQMIFRISWEATQPVLFYPWRVSIDQITWDITQ